MEKIASFTINHLDLLPGVYVSRKDKIGDNTVTTFDIRVTRPNFEPVLNNAEIHAIEHLAATFLRNHKDFAQKIVYFGPMGCRTGFYLILSDDYVSKDIINLLVEMFEFISKYDDVIPGASAKDCGNYLDMNLPMARYVASKYLKEVLSNINEKNTNYPE
jgi:S-ribosylhomocysteine lyase